MKIELEIDEEKYNFLNNYAKITKRDLTTLVNLLFLHDIEMLEDQIKSLI